MDPTTSIVKIIAYAININWFSPFKIKSESEIIGSGFFIDNKGHILTSAHVIENCIKIYITVPAEGKYKIPVDLISVCFDKDIALLKVKDYINKSYCELGDSDKIVQGEEVIAIGYPLGQDHLKYTKGIISGLHSRYIQTDTPINTGNSGGPLLDKNNKVIGINTSKITSAYNISYATPINDFYIIKDEMFNNNDIKIIYEPVSLFEGSNSDENLFKILKFNGDSGYFLKKIYKKSPYCKAGMRSGDILTKFNGYKVDNHGECIVPWSKEKIHVKDLIHKYTVNDVIPIEYWSFRKGNKFIRSELIFDKIPPLKIIKLYPPLDTIQYEIFGGMVIMELNMNHLIDLDDNEDVPENLKNQLKLFFNTNYRFLDQLIITDILQGSYVYSLENIDVGELIDRVNGKYVNTLKDFVRYINKPIVIDDKDYTIIQTKENTTIILDNAKEKDEREFLFSVHKIYKNL